MDSDLATPFPLIAGTVRNPREAAALAELDVLAIKEECLLEHLCATALYARTLDDAVESISKDGSDPATGPAVTLLQAAQEALQQGDGWLRECAEGVMQQMAACQLLLKSLAEINHSLHAELQEEGCEALAKNKRRLWLVEESLCHRVALRRSE